MINDFDESTNLITSFTERIHLQNLIIKSNHFLRS